MAVRPVKGKSDSTGAAAPSAKLTKPRAKPTKPRAKPAKAQARPTKAPPGPTSIRVHCNVGLGNRITVRGDTDPFRWDGGVDTQNTAADVWELPLERIPAGQSFQFKPLINDATYSTGDNFVGTGGQSLDIYPAF
jgi:hypothetical protein